MEALEGLGDFKIGGKKVHTLKYADELGLLAREEKVLQGIFDRTIEIGRFYCYFCGSTSAPFGELLSMVTKLGHFGK
jgi:hypothetical protein